MRNQYKVLQEAYEQVIEAHGLQKLSDEDELAIVDLYDKGILNNIPDQANQHKLAAMAGVSKPTIRRILKKYNRLGIIGSKQKIDSNGNLVASGQMYPPEEVDYINKLLSTKEEREVNGTYPFAYSADTIENMVNDHIKNHPELTVGWVPAKARTITGIYINKYQQKINRLRTDDGVRTKTGRIQYTPRAPEDALATQNKDDTNIVNDPAYQAGTRFGRGSEQLPVKGSI